MMLSSGSSWVQPSAAGARRSAACLQPPYGAQPSASKFAGCVRATCSRGSQQVRVAVAEYRHTSHGMHSDDQGSPGAEPLAAQQPAPVVEPSPCQLLAQHLGLPAGKLERLLQRQPEMLRVPANRLVMRLQQLSRFMRLPMEQVVVMVARHPGVLSAPPTLIQSKARDMLRKLKLPKESVMPLLARQPEFLEVPIEKLVSRCELLCSCLNVDTLTAVTALSRLPPTPLFAVLGLRPTFLPVRVVELGRLLQVSTSTPSTQAPGAPLPDDPTLADDGRIAFTPLLMRSPMPAAQRSVPPHEWAAVRANLRRAASAIEQRSFEAGRLPEGPGIVAQLVLKCPQLLLVSMRSMAASYNVLRDVMQASPGKVLSVLKRSPALLLLPAATLLATCSSLQRILGLDRSALATRLAQQPQLLQLSERQVSERLAALGAALAWSPAAVQRAVRNQPQLLTASAARIAFKVTALAAMLRVPRAVADEMVQAQPALLTLAVPTILRNLRGVQGALLGDASQGDGAGVQRLSQLQAERPTSVQLNQPAVEQAGHSGQGGKRRPKAAERASEHPQSATAQSDVQMGHSSNFTCSNTTENGGSSSSNTNIGGSGSNSAKAGGCNSSGNEGGGSGTSSSSSEALADVNPSVFPHGSVVDAAVMHPTLLTLPPKTLASKVEALQRMLRMDTRSVQALLRDHPLLLSVSRANLQFRLNEVQLALHVPLGAAAQLLVANPELVVGVPPLAWKPCLALALGVSDEQQTSGTAEWDEDGGGGSAPPEQRAVQALKVLLRRGEEAELKMVLQRVQATLSSQGFS